MLITTTIFTALCSFFSEHSGDIASKMVASAGYDILKKSLDFKGLSQRIKKFFKNEAQADKLIEQICNNELPEDQQPEFALQTAFETLTNESYSPNLLSEIKSWIDENKEAIIQNSTNNFNNTSGLNIGVQQAKGNIYNVQGDYNINHGKKEN